MRWFTRGDLDGFFGLALDNLVQLLVIAGLWKALGFPDPILYQHVLPGVAVSLLVGNLFYGWQARRLALATGRNDVCALPYGINTVSLFAHFFFVLLPARDAAAKAGALDPARVAWQAGLVATLVSGLIEFAGSFVAERIRKATPRAALLSTLAGIALGFICLGFFFRTFAHPVVGFTTLGIIFLTYFGRVKFRGGLPGGFVAISLGTLLAWTTGITQATKPPNEFALQLPVPVLGDVLSALAGPHLLAYLSVIIPMGLFNLIGSLQNIESAEAAGDRYPTAPSLAVNGIGSIAAALFGSCFPTTIYIGHPGWKALGARAGYSILNGLFFTVVCLTGTLSLIAWAVPVDAGMAMVIWIGIVITAQAFQATPKEHAPAVVVGLLPGVAAWGTIMAKFGVKAAASLRPSDVPLFSEPLVSAFQTFDTWIGGAFALEQGFIFTSMILAAATVAVIERDFLLASVWCMIAALLSLTGLMHSYQFGKTDTEVLLQPAWPWVRGYVVMGTCFFFARWLTVPDKAHH